MNATNDSLGLLNSTKIECVGWKKCPSQKCAKFEQETCGPVTYMAFLNVAAFLAIFINGLHIIGLKQTPNLLKSNHGFIIFCMAVLDMLTSFSSMIVSNCSVQEVMLTYQRMCSLSVLVHGLPPILSAYILMLISVDRLRAVARVAKIQRATENGFFENRFKIITAVMLCAVVLSAGIFFVADAKFTDIRPCHTGFTMCRIDPDLSATAGLASLVVIYCPIIVTFSNYCAMAIILRMKIRRDGPMHINRKLRSSIISIGVICITFFLSYLPIAALKVINIFNATGELPHFIGIFLLSSSAIANPIVYLICQQDYRKAVKAIFLRKGGVEPSNGGLG